MKAVPLFVSPFCEKGENAMKYIDDILYLLGWICVIVTAFTYDLQLGGVVMGIGCFVTSWIFAKYGARHGDRR